MKDNWIEAWRIFELDSKNLKPKTLMHQHKGSKFLPLNKSLIAYQGIVSNPGKKHRTYRAGWHVGLDKLAIEKYLKAFTADRKLCVCRVLVKNIREKPRAISPIFLAKEMMVLEKDWEQAVNIYN